MKVGVIGAGTMGQGIAKAFLKMLCSTGTSLLQCVCISDVILLGRACPKPCS